MLTPYFGAFIPNGRAVNPISKTSWEGTGVVPDVKVPVDDALATAHQLHCAVRHEAINLSAAASRNTVVA